LDLELLSPLAGWCVPLGSVPDAVFAGGMMGGGVAIDPVGDTLHAPCAATVQTVHAARHAVVLRTAAGVELLMHLGIDTVALAGEGFEVLVRGGQAVAAGDPLIRFDLDRLVLAGCPVVTPIVATGDGLTTVPLAMDRAVAVGDPLLRIAGAATATPMAIEAGGRRRELRVGLAHGLHARPAARIAAAMRPLDARVTVTAGDRSAAVTSSVGLLGLALEHDASLTAHAEGPEADAALDRLAALLATEPADDAPAPPPRAQASPLPAGARVGVGAVPGLAIGPARWLDGGTLSLPQAGEGVSAERARLETALASVWAALDGEAAAGTGPAAAIAAAHRALVDDPVLHAAADAGIARGLHAATAFADATAAEAARLRASGSARIRERGDDLDDLGRRVARAAIGAGDDATSFVAGSILLADDLLPSHLLSPGAGALAGIALRGGGATSHVAILAAGLGVPLVVALGGELDGIADGDALLLDADAGAVVVAPDPELVAATRARIARQAEAERVARAAGDGPTHTGDGTAVAVLANIASVADAQAAVREGAQGSGLLRTEFLFLDRTAAPGVDEQADSYRAIAAALAGRPLTLRLLDIGGDKPATYLSIPAEENPALGERGIRVLLARPALLDAQLRAAVRAGPTVRIMVPMIAGVDELAAVRAALERVAAAEGVDVPPLGVMVETPAAALIADRLAAAADFLSIGSNDLTQYALAMDRGNPAVTAAADGLHPAVLRLIALTCEGAGTTPVGVCGGLAADPLAVPILVGLGVRSLSVPPARVAATRAAVSRLRLGAARDLARAALGCGSGAAVRALARGLVENDA